MSLRGNLNSVDLANIFQMLSINQKEGTLNIFDGQSKKSIYFSRDGVSMLSRGRTKTDSLGEILLRYDRITEEQLEKALLMQRQSGKVLAIILEETGLVPREVIDDALRIQIEEEIYNLFVWKDASFEFLEGIAPEEFKELGGNMPRLTFNVNSLIMEAARRIDEWDQIHAHIPSLTEIYRYSGRNMELTDEIFQEVWTEKVLASINGKLNVDEIVEQSHVGRFEVCKILFFLIDQEAIEPVSAEDLEKCAQEAGARNEIPDAIKFYERVIELRGDTAATHLQLGQAYEKAHELRKASGHLQRYAEHCLNLGRAEEAYQLQQRICEMLPTDLRATERLIQVYVENAEALQSVGLDVIERGKRLARVLEQLGKNTQAVQILQKIIGFAPDDLSLRNLLINIYLASGMSSEAIAEYEALADYYTKKREWEKVIKILRKVLVIDRNRDDISQRLHHLLTRRQSRKKSLKRIAFLVLVVSAIGALGYAYGTYEIGGQRRAAEAEAAAARAIAALEIQMVPVRRALEQLRAELSKGEVDAEELVKTFEHAEKMNVQYESQIYAAIDELKSVAAEFKYSTAHKQAVQKQEDLGMMLQRFRQTLDDAGKQIQVYALELMKEGGVRLKRGDGKGALEVYRKAWKVARDRKPLKENNVPERISQLEADLAGIAKLVAEQKKHLAAHRYESAVQTALTLVDDYLIYPDVLGQVVMAVRVTSDPEGAEILVDGKSSGAKTPGWITYNLLEGASIQLMKSGYTTEHYNIPPVHGRDRESVVASLKKYSRLDSKLRKELTSERTLKGAIEALPVVGARSVYFATRSSQVFRMDMESGDVFEIFKAKSIGGIKSSPALAGSSLYLATLEGRVLRLDRKKDAWALAWITELESMVTAPLVVAGETILVGDWAGRLTALDVETGKVVGQQTVAGEIRDRPVLGEDRVYVVSTEGTLHAFALSGLAPLPKVDAQFEELRLGGAPTVCETRMYLRGTNGSLYAYDLETSERLWECRFRSELRCHPVEVDDAVIVATIDGRIHAVEDGKFVATYNLGGSVTASPTAKGEALFIATEQGRCASLRYRGGEFALTWKIDLTSKEESPLRILVSPVVIGDMVVLAAESGEVFVLSE